MKTKADMADLAKWLHKDWKPTETQGPGHQTPLESKLVRTAEEAEKLLSEGWTEAAPAPGAVAAEPVAKKPKEAAPKKKE